MVLVVVFFWIHFTHYNLIELVFFFTAFFLPLFPYKGFVNCMLYDDFVQRYHMLSHDHIHGHAPVDTCEFTRELLQSMGLLMEELDVSEDHFSLGKKKVFLK